jgi:hypothetical protein
MSTDRYTKAVLTVIAISLAIIAIRNVPFVGLAQAQSDEPIRVQICDDFFSSRCADVGIGGALLVEIDE